MAMAAGPTIGIIGGGGWLGGAIARSALRAGIVTADRLSLSYRSKRGPDMPGAFWTADNRALVERSDIVILSVRPADWPSLSISAACRLVVSVMAGVPMNDLAHRLEADRIVRALPNAAAEIGASYTPWVASPGVGDDDRALMRQLWQACGTEDEIPRESDLDYLTGLSGSGPAFPALLARAMMRAAISHGLDPRVASRAVDAVFVGSGRLIEAYDWNPSDTVETFLAYRGTTAAAIEAMQAAGLEAAVRAGLDAALHRSVQLSKGV